MYWKSQDFAVTSFWPLSPLNVDLSEFLYKQTFFYLAQATLKRGEDFLKLLRAGLQFCTVALLEYQIKRCLFYRIVILILAHIVFLCLWMNFDDPWTLLNLWWSLNFFNGRSTLIIGETLNNFFKVVFRTLWNITDGGFLQI